MVLVDILQLIPFYFLFLVSKLNLYNTCEYISLSGVSIK